MIRNREALTTNLKMNANILLARYGIVAIVTKSAMLSSGSSPSLNINTIQDEIEVYMYIIHNAGISSGSF